ncbi:MarR family winged helix-turn-helix transcriptional regulator [Sedimentitalea todarodis]|uniref:MarR family transcriptional regulator n=1 Tax=Sedimentitalea todarodis TaxID=1631240 RepID=A0ABU3VDR6_9RHOB|nr:MarR family transcriptional regulator [Sedimentitalea todarodis]MDU9004299.1 MarR family transcriptional regulator [Sedimentitalea todarodis]
MAQRDTDKGTAARTIPAAAQASASKERLRLWLRLLKSTRRVESQLRENLRIEFNSTLPRFDVLAALARYQDGLKMSALSGVLRVSNGNVTGIVDRLTQEGLVVRMQVPGDRRAMLVRLTDKGREVFAAQAEAHERWIDDLLGGFTLEEARSFSDRFETITNLDEEGGQ